MKKVIFWSRCVPSNLEHRGNGKAVHAAFHRHHHHHRLQVKPLFQKAIWRLLLSQFLGHFLPPSCTLLNPCCAPVSSTLFCMMVPESQKVPRSPTWEVYPSQWCCWRPEWDVLWILVAVFVWWICSRSNLKWSSLKTIEKLLLLGSWNKHQVRNCIELL